MGNVFDDIATLPQPKYQDQNEAMHITLYHPYWHNYIAEKSDYMWLGYTFNSQKGVWETPDGDILKYTNFKRESDLINPGNNTCVAMDFVCLL